MPIDSIALHPQEHLTTEPLTRTASINVATQHGSRAPRAITSLPAEILLDIFARLPAASLSTAERACRIFHALINNEAAWKQAFWVNLAPGKTEALAPGRRVAGSWRKEYILRSRLITRWQKLPSKGQYISDLKLSHLTHLAAQPSGYCIALSSWSGHGLVVSPQTGTRGAKLAAAPDIEDEITSAAIIHQGEVLWGMRSGQVRWCTTGSATKPFRTDFQLVGQNRAAVTCLIGLPNDTVLNSDSDEESCFVAAGSLDGRVAVYEYKTATLAWSSQQEQRLYDDNDIPLAVTHIDTSASFLLVGSATGLVALLDLRTSSRLDIRANGTQPVLHLEALSDQECIYALLGDASFRHVQIENGVVVQERAYYLPGPQAPCITALKADVSRTKLHGFGQQSYVVAGCDDGSVSVWLLASTEENAHVPPVLRLPKPESGLKVTALELSPFALFVGSIDGSVRVYDIVSGQLLKTLNEKVSPRHAMRLVGIGQADERRYQVTCLKTSLNGNAIYATVGERLFAWAVLADGVHQKTRKRRLRPGVRISSRQERYLGKLFQQHHFLTELAAEDQEWQEEALDVRQELDDESEWRANRLGTPVRSDGHAFNVDLTESEAIAYAEMLSREAEELRQAHQAAEDESFALALSASDDLDPDELLSPAASPYLRPVTSVHASPHLLAANPFSGPSTSGRRILAGQPTQDIEAWPLPSPSHSSGPSSWTRLSSDVSMGTPSPASKGAWSSVVKLPALSPTKPAPEGPPISALTKQMQAKQAPEQQAILSSREQEEADLRYAIELSLAEANSRADH